MIDHNHFICHFIFGGHLLNIPNLRTNAFVLQLIFSQIPLLFLSITMKNIFITCSTEELF